MKALSIQEPWASMILVGDKTIETRVWKTSYRGKLLICASAKPQGQFSGYAIAVANLVDCRPMTKEDEDNAGCKIYPNAYAWVLSDIKAITPFKVKGQLRLFEVDYDE